MNLLQPSIFYSLQYKPLSAKYNLQCQIPKEIQEYILQCKTWILAKLRNPQKVSTSDYRNCSYRTFHNL